MDLNDLHPPDDYSHRFFIWHEWIQANGPLTNENVLEYFATSMFYDKQSTNQQLRMQTMHAGPLVNEAEELKRFTGVEFALVHSQPPSLFIIHKRHRVSPDEARPLTAYFIMNNRIYQSPDVYTLISNRLLTSLHSLQTSMDTLRSRRPAYTPRTGFVWPISDPSLSQDGKRREDGEENASPEPAPEQAEDHMSEETSAKPKLGSTPADGKKRQNNMLLFNAMRTTALHANQSFTLPVNATEKPTEETVAVPATRSSLTPAPIPPRVPTPKSASSVSAPTPQESQQPIKGQPGAGKKKKKRTSLAPPPGQT